jgi:ubiquinone/menaquinone biosynthesis C-methylase UbiE
MPLGSLLAEFVSKYSSMGWWYYKLFGMPDIGLRIRSSFILRLLECPSGGRILDAGCGMGTLALSLAKIGAEVVGVDLSMQAIANCRIMAQKLGLRNTDFQLQDLCKLSFESNTFDCIICADVVEHVPDHAKMTSEMARVLKPGGILVLSTVLPTTTQRSFFYRARAENHRHVREGYTVDQLSHLLMSAGLHIRRVLYSDRLFERIAWEIDQLVKGQALFRRMLFPLLLGLSKFDRLLPPTVKGNNITVSAQKLQ